MTAVLTLMELIHSLFQTTEKFLSHVTLCNPMDCSQSGSSIHVDILWARILEWVAMPSSRGSSQPRDRTQVSHIAGGFFTV